MKNITIGNVAGCLLGIFFIHLFYSFRIDAWEQASVPNCIFTILVFLLFAYLSFWNKETFNARDQRLLAFVIGILLGQIVLSALKHLSSWFPYLVTLSFIAGTILSRLCPNYLRDEE